MRVNMRVNMCGNMHSEDHIYESKSKNCMLA